MKLRKDKWEKETLENIFKLKSGNALPNHKIIEGNFPVYGGMALWVIMKNLWLKNQQ